MLCKLRLAIAISAAVSCFSISLPIQGQQNAEYLLRSETGLTGTFHGPLPKQPVWFDASTEDGVLTLHLGLNAQSVTLRLGQGEFHLNSSNNTAAGLSTLSAEEEETLQQLATHLDRELENPSAFDASVICAIRNLGSLPTDMPLSISIDSETKTVGDVSVPMAEVQEAHRKAMEELSGQFSGAEMELPTKSIVSLCNSIGKTQTACYPTSIVPYREKCENALVGGTTCRGRCGTLCNGLCTGQKYTKDCHNHDRCADVYGISHRYCNFIFNSTFDDCALAPNCTDLPGTWNISFHWTNSNPNATVLDIFPNRKVTSADGGAGTWNVTNNKATLTFTGGCKPTYTGTLSKDRLSLSGTMRCTTRSDGGTWNASKTNGTLPAGTRNQTNDPAPALDHRGALSSPPD
jgi:hypothetical protein